MNTLTIRDGNFLNMHSTSAIPSHTLIDFDSRDEALATIRDDLQHSDSQVYFKTLRDCHPEASSSLYIPSTLRNRFENITAFYSGSEGCLWSVEENNEPLVLKIYRENIHPNADALEHIANMRHKNLVGLKEWGATSGKTYEILEKIDGDSMHDLMGAFYDASLKKRLKEISEALNYLHEKSIIHADVKPENILFDANDSVTKLCDYGLCAMSATNASVPRQGQTPMFSAPEVVSGSIVFKSDFYSLGMTILYALTSLTDLSRWQEWSGFDQSKTNWRELFNGLLEENIDQRWGFEEIQNWLESQNDKVAKNSSNFKSSKQLARHLAINWAEMTANMREDTFEAWIRGQFKELSISENIIDQSKSEDNDIYLLRLIYTLDPSFEPQYKEYKINENNLLIISQKVLNNDIAAQMLIEEIYDKKIISELYELTKIDSLMKIDETWVRQVDAYKEAVAFAKSKNAQMSVFNNAKDLALLYIRRESKYDYEIIWNDSDALCYMWINYLVAKSDDGNGYGLAASLMTNHYRTLLEDNLRVSQSLARARMQQYTGESHFLTIWRLWHRVRTFMRARRNLITPDMHVNARAALTVAQTPILYSLCNKQLQIGNRVKLSWNIRNSVLNYITEIGFVNEVGTYELTLSETKVYTLYSFDARGNYQRCEVLVEAIKLSLSPMIQFDMEQEKLGNLFELLPLSEKVELFQQSEMFEQLSSTVNAIELFEVGDANMKKVDLFPQKECEIDVLTIDSIKELTFVEKGDVME